MRKETIEWLIPALIAVAAAIALWFYWVVSQRDDRPAETAPADTVVPADAEARKGPLHPLPEPHGPGADRPTLRPLPPLDQSDEYFKLEVVELFGEPLATSLAESRVIERLVASVDNLPREHIAQRMRPITGVDGQFMVEQLQTAGEYRLHPDNYERYVVLVTMLANADTSTVIDVYKRFFPLLQNAYVNLGYPDGYFNDRVVEVIDHLLETPDVADAPMLKRPHVLYEYADPDLEALSSGQKLLIRMGPEHRQAVKDKLREFRERIAGNASSILDDSSGGSGVDAQATSLLGRPLVSMPPDADTLAKLEAARNDYERDPGNVENVIWYGRRLAYAGNYREASRVYSQGIEQHPDDARLYRHRGHRYITLRDFASAIRDLEQAVTLIEGREDEIEPDGLPNARNIPVSTLHGNIWYHLGLAYYLQHDWDNAWRAYEAGYATSDNDDNRVSTTHWRYMILRRQGKLDEAAAILTDISADMQVIENDVYHRLCLFYKGEIPLDEMLAEDAGGASGAAGAYGVANWLYYSGEEARARDRLAELAASEDWAAFGVIAAEADLASG
jgi:tetratricopeptide (TPR) repeat protein